MKAKESKELDKAVIVLTSEDTTVAVLGGELDNEDYWEETGENEFKHKFNKDVELVTSCNEDKVQFHYVVEHNEKYKVQFVNAETNEELTPSLNMNELIQNISDNDNIKVYDKRILNDRMTLKCIILNRKIEIKMFRLLSLSKPKYTLSIAMATC